MRIEMDKLAVGGCPLSVGCCLFVAKISYDRRGCEKNARTDIMSAYHTIRINDRQRDKSYCVQVPEDRYILPCAENQGSDLPYSCRNGACTTCAVRVISGQLYQPEAMGLSPELQEEGYALLCVSYPRSDLEVETQDEDEVYELQFGRYFGKGKVRSGLPLDED